VFLFLLVIGGLVRVRGHVVVMVVILIRRIGCFFQVLADLVQVIVDFSQVIGLLLVMIVGFVGVIASFR